LPNQHGVRRDCVITAQCRLRNTFEAARNAFLAELDRHTIGEVAQPHGPLAALLGMSNVIPIMPAASAGGEAASAVRNAPGDSLASNVK
jgi:Rrf2 family nitric oxide-sensitive transcriptional repressor